MSDENRDSHNDASRAEKGDKRQRLKKQMALHYVLTASVCHAGRIRLPVLWRILLPPPPRLSLPRNTLLFNKQEGKAAASACNLIHHLPLHLNNGDSKEEDK